MLELLLSQQRVVGALVLFKRIQSKSGCYSSCRCRFTLDCVTCELCAAGVGWQVQLLYQKTFPQEGVNPPVTCPQELKSLLLDYESVKQTSRVLVATHQDAVL